MARPAEHQLPAVQARHSSALLKPSWLLKLPLPHGVGAELPLAHHDEGGHVSQAVAPSADWYEPASHRLHIAVPPLGATLPGAQTVGATEPARHALPARHGMQPSAEARPVALL